MILFVAPLSLNFQGYRYYRSVIFYYYLLLFMSHACVLSFAFLIPELTTLSPFLIKPNFVVVAPLSLNFQGYMCYRSVTIIIMIYYYLRHMHV